MREQLLALLHPSGQLALETIVLRMAVGTGLALFLSLSYAISHEGSIYSRKFNVSLMALTTVTTGVMIVIGNNIALSLGMVGALSIVRFRTAIKDARDTVYIFWAIVVGICCGAGDFWVAGMASAFTFLVLLLFGRIKNEDRLLLIVRAPRVQEERLEALIFQYYAHKASLRVKNTTETSVELIYELSRRSKERVERSRQKAGSYQSITEAIYGIGGVEYCNLVLQNDEISG